MCPVPIVNQFLDVFTEFKYLKAMMKYRVFNTVNEVISLAEKYEEIMAQLIPLKPQKCDHEYQDEQEDCESK